MNDLQTLLEAVRMQTTAIQKLNGTVTALGLICATIVARSGHFPDADALIADYQSTILFSGLDDEGVATALTTLQKTLKPELRG